MRRSKFQPHPCPECERRIAVAPIRQRVWPHNGADGERCPGTGQWVDLYGERPERITSPYEALAAE